MERPELELKPEPLDRSTGPNDGAEDPHIDEENLDIGIGNIGPLCVETGC